MGKQILHLCLAISLLCATTVLAAETASGEQAADAEKGAGALVLAVISNDMGRVKQLLANGANVNDPESTVGNTPLHEAKDKAMAEFLISMGANVNAFTRTGGQPVHKAAAAGRTDVIETLLAAGADANALTTTNKWLIEALREGGTLEAQSTREPEGNLTLNRLDETPLHLAAGSGKVSAIKLLLQHGARLEAKTRVGWTPLAYACAARKLAAVRALLESGASVTAASESGYTGLHFLLLMGNRGDPQNDVDRLEVIRVMVKHGADVDAKSKDGRTPLHLATEVKDRDIVRVLLELGADGTIKDNNGVPAAPPAGLWEKLIDSLF